MKTQPQKHEVIVFGEYRCSKAVYYAEELDSRNVDYEFIDVSEDDIGAERLKLLYADRKIKFPTLLIADKRLRNPTIEELDKTLARYQLIDLGVVHQAHANRFVIYMLPSDFFISYKNSADKIILSHVQHPPDLQQDLINENIHKILDYIKDNDFQFAITSPAIKHLSQNNI